ncbi:hypothetical protein EYF80_015932 [Liparis tanakae]|uniref:Uncharacterized protein n=1 Tax=Liparis tanakae TaxID=230148 RepID=A0A4Z2I932_9TELE|nr:hypothetical protein EYF80_015932 [Liparis tanakae]
MAFTSLGLQERISFMLLLRTPPPPHLLPSDPDLSASYTHHVISLIGNTPIITTIFITPASSELHGAIYLVADRGKRPSITNLPAESKRQRL